MLTLSFVDKDEKKTKPDPVYWVGVSPTECDIGGEKIRKSFVDGRTKMGPWANMCLKCSREHGVGVGQGKGQLYQKQADNRWLKTQG